MWPNVVGVAGHGTIPVGLQFTRKEKPLKTHNNDMRSSQANSLLQTLERGRESTKIETLWEHYRHIKDTLLTRTIIKGHYGGI